MYVFEFTAVNDRLVSQTEPPKLVARTSSPSSSNRQSLSSDLLPSFLPSILPYLQAKPFVRKLIVDGGGMKLLLPALSAHRDHNVQLQILRAVKTLLPAAPPKPFVAGLC